MTRHYMVLVTRAPGEMRLSPEKPTETCLDKRQQPDYCETPCLNPVGCESDVFPLSLHRIVESRLPTGVRWCGGKTLTEIQTLSRGSLHLTIYTARTFFPDYRLHVYSDLRRVTYRGIPVIFILPKNGFTNATKRAGEHAESSCVERSRFSGGSVCYDWENILCAVNKVIPGLGLENPNGKPGLERCRNLLASRCFGVGPRNIRCSDGGFPQFFWRLFFLGNVPPSGSPVCWNVFSSWLRRFSAPQ